MKKFAIQKNIGSEQVRRVVKIGDEVEVCIQQEYIPKGFFSPALPIWVPIKVTMLTVTPEQKIICGTCGIVQYIFNITEKRFIKTSHNGMEEGKIDTEIVKCNGINLNYDSAKDEWHYYVVKENVKKFMPLEVGDIIKKESYDYKVLAISKDGSIFIEMIVPDNSAYYKKNKLSMMLRTNDISGYSVFKGLEVIND